MSHTPPTDEELRELFGSALPMQTTRDSPEFWNVLEANLRAERRGPEALRLLRSLRRRDQQASGVEPFWPRKARKFIVIATAWWGAMTVGLIPEAAHFGIGFLPLLITSLLSPVACIAFTIDVGVQIPALYRRELSRSEAIVLGAEALLALLAGVFFYLVGR